MNQSLVRPLTYFRLSILICALATPIALAKPDSASVKGSTQTFAAKSIIVSGPDPDSDGDGIADSVDNCPLTPNPDQSDIDNDGIGDVCDPCPNTVSNDTDGDGVCDDVDNCPLDANTDQTDADSDGIGDACDLCPNDPTNACDTDGDFVPNDVDNCPFDANADQADTDNDGIGDVCDNCFGPGAADTDGDGVCDGADNCPTLFNPGQEDADNDGLGDVCDVTECISAPPGMIGWWPGDGNVNDIVNGNNGTAVGGSSIFASGKVDQAMNFNGTTDSITIPHAANMDPNPAYSFDAWVYWTGTPIPNTTDHAAILVKTQESLGADSYSMFIHKDKYLYNIIGDGQLVTPTDSVPVGEWFHVAQTFDGTTAKVYINGQLATSATGITRTVSSGVLAFGTREGVQHFFNGLLDEIEIFDRELTQEEVVAIYGAGSLGKCKCTPPPADMISWWPGDQNANDIRGFHDGTRQGDTGFDPGKVGLAFSFDGDGDYVDVGDVDLPVAFTIDAWIQLTDFSPGSSAILTKADGTNFSYLFRVGSNGELRAEVYSAGGETAYTTDFSSIETGEWQHVAVVYNGNAPATERIRFFINGQEEPALVQSGSDNGGAPNNIAFPAKIGIYAASGQPFQGLIDEVEVFGRALCQPEIEAIFNAGAAGKCKPRLNVDFGTASPDSPVQDGFQSFSILDDVSSTWGAVYTGLDLATAPNGNVALSVDASVNFVARDRATTPPNSGGFTFSDLYRDLIGVTGAPIAIALQGLQPNTVFDVTFYAYDDVNASNPVDNTVTFTNTTNGGSIPFSSITYGLSGGGPVSSNHQYSTRMRVISNASGQLTFSETSSGPQGGPLLNGLQIAPVQTSSLCQSAPAALQLLNISTRAAVGTGDNVAIAGFIIGDDTGARHANGVTSTKTLLIRGLGPSLSVDGTPVVGRLADTVLELYDSGHDLITSNDDWVDAPNATNITDSGLAPSDNHESAILITLDSNSPYTAILKGKNDSTGIGLVEVYDLEPNLGARMANGSTQGAPTGGTLLANISTRGQVLTGDDVLIGGIIVSSGNTRSILFRAIGPSLSNFSVSNPLQNPQIDLHDGQGTLIAHNDNWKEEPDGTANGTREAQISATGLPPNNDAEAAILYISPPPGSYTAIVSGVGGSTGVALVEAYRLSPSP